jgi:hypothetical protein
MPNLCAFGFQFCKHRINIVDSDVDPTTYMSLIGFGEEKMTPIAGNRSEAIHDPPIVSKPKHARVVIHTGAGICDTQNRRRPSDGN